MNKQFKIDFIKSGRGKAQCPSDPNYPNGIDINIARPDEEACIVDIPYPAPECGFYKIECQFCHNITVITTAGRPDDPRTLRIPCLKIENEVKS